MILSSKKFESILQMWDEKFSPTLIEKSNIGKINAYKIMKQHKFKAYDKLSSNIVNTKNYTMLKT